MIEKKNFWYETMWLDTAEKLKEFLDNHIIEYDVSLLGAYISNRVYRFDVYCGDDEAQEVRRFLSDLDSIKNLDA